MRRAGLIALGGAVGALGRWAVGLSLGETLARVAVAVFMVNVIGAFALGFLAGRLARRPWPEKVLGPLIGVGFLGAFTTFSGFVVVLVRLPFAAGLAYALFMVSSGLAAAEGGRRLGRRA